MVDFLVWSLDAVGEPVDDVLGLLFDGLEVVDVIEPLVYPRRVAFGGAWRQVEVEAIDARSVYPPTLDDEPVLDDLRQAWRPGHLLHSAVVIEPCGRGDRNWLALLVARPSVHWRAAGIDAAPRPRRQARDEYVVVRRHVGAKVVNRDAFGV